MNKAFEKILERLEEESFERQIPVFTERAEMVIDSEKARQIVQEVADEYHGGWIPCSERLPEEGVEVLVWFEYFRYGKYNRLFQMTGISYVYNGDWSGFVNGSSGWRDLKIIAWQPLPEPYQPKGEGEAWQNI